MRLPKKSIIKFVATLLAFIILSGLYITQGKILLKLDAQDEIHTIYENSLEDSWVNWSWGSNVTFTGMIIVKNVSPWSALYLHTEKPFTERNKLLTVVAKTSDSRTEYKIALFGTNGQPINSFLKLSTYGFLTVDNWKVINIPVSNLNPQQKQIAGVVIQDTSGRSGHTLYVKSLKFTNTSGSQVTNSGYLASNNSIYKNGQKIKLHGISWFGFETDTHVPHGLWARNWKEIIEQIRVLGFNSVRIPTCPADLKGTAVKGINMVLNPDLAKLNSTQILDKIMYEFNAKQIYILLDHHRADCNTISDLWYTDSYSENDWINDLRFMANRYKNIEYFMGIDIKNEPHGRATWGIGKPATDWNTAAEKAGREILSANPSLLIFIQGIQDNPICSNNNFGHWMGGNLEPVNCKPISTNMIPSNKLVLSPHVYGPDVYNQGYFSAKNFPNNLIAIWDKDFGNLTQKGYTIVPGEWGGKYGNGGNPKDVTWQNSIVGYFKNKKICNSYYWDFNPNSKDTGGVLKDDWKTPWQNKIDLIKSYFDNCN